MSKDFSTTIDSTLNSNCPASIVDTAKGSRKNVFCDYTAFGNPKSCNRDDDDGKKNPKICLGRITCGPGGCPAGAEALVGTDCFGEGRFYRICGNGCDPAYVPVPWVPYFEVVAPAPIKQTCISMDTPTSSFLSGYTKFILTTFVVSANYGGFPATIKVTDGLSNPLWDFQPVAPEAPFPPHSVYNKVYPNFKAYSLQDANINAGAVVDNKLPFSSIASKATDKICFNIVDNSYLVYQFNVIYVNPLTGETLIAPQPLKGTGSSRPLSGVNYDDAPTECLIDLTPASTDIPPYQQSGVVSA